MISFRYYYNSIRGSTLSCISLHFFLFWFPSFARVFFLQQWRKGFGGWCDSPCLLVNFEAGKSGEAERKTGGSSLIGNFPERNPVDHGYIWPNIAVRVNERAKGWRRWRGVSPRSPLQLFLAKIRLHPDTFHPHLVEHWLGRKCQRVWVSSLAWIFEETFMVDWRWEMIYFLIKIPFFFFHFEDIYLFLDVF